MLSYVIPLNEFLDDVQAQLYKAKWQDASRIFRGKPLRLLQSGFSTISYGVTLTFMCVNRDSKTVA